MDHHLEPLHQKRYLVDGQLLEWSGECQEVVSPIGPSTIGSYPLLTATESTAALQAAVKAYDHGRGQWPTMSVGERIERLEDFTFRMKERREEVVRLLMWEIGKNLPDSLKEFDRTVDFIRATIDALKELDRASSRFVLEEGIMAQVRRAPLGTVLCMGPYNYPLNETYATLIPALLMGNTVVFKPPKYGVLLHEPLLAAFQAAFPPGVVNTVYGDGARTIGPLMESGLVDVLAFIGSTRVANLLKKQHPHPNRLRSVLGLGAKNPAIVLADADLDLTVRECLLGSLSFNGQRCTALKLLFVHQDLVEEFVQRLAAGVEALKCGLPWEDGVQITPLPEGGKPAYLAELVQDARSKGARVVNSDGGKADGALFRPAVLYPVDASMRVYQEEQFGPVVPVVPFRELDEPIGYMVASHYGQQISLFGQDPETMARLIDPLVNQVCRVNLNCQCQRGPDMLPFTGRKDSAEGTLSISDALRVFSIRTLVAAKQTPASKAMLTRILRERHSNFLSTDFLL